MGERTISQILAVLIVISMFSTSTASSNSFTVRAQPVTLEEILAAINALDEKLNGVETTTASLNSALNSLITAVDNMQSQLDSLSATTATKVEVAILDSALNELNNTISNLETDLASLNATVASRSDLGSAVDELSNILDEVEVSLSSLSNEAAKSTDLDAATSKLSEDIDILKRLIIIAIVLALMAVVASITAFYYMLKHSDKALQTKAKPTSLSSIHPHFSISLTT